MTRDHLIVVSDVHIGVGAATNWYQPAFHEPMLRAVFDWILARAETISELVILGDFVDLWTYVPERRPPAFAEVAAANPAIFAPVEGALARVIDALDGAVTYVPGNHDMTVTEGDLAAIRGGRGRGPRLATAFPYLPALGGGRVACAHGHQFSIFNAPDRHAMPDSGLPLGHLITRLAAGWTQRHLGPGQTAADLEGAGEPTGWVFEKTELLTLVIDAVHGVRSIADLVIDALLRATGDARTLPVTMPGGRTVTVAELLEGYGDVYTRCARGDFPGAGYGIRPEFFALVDVDARNSLDHFAHELGQRHPVVIMGHTHSPSDAIERPLLVGATDLYVNSGFHCPARPDFTRAQAPRRPTFVDLQIDPATARTTASVRVIEAGPDRPRVADAPLAAARI